MLRGLDCGARVGCPPLAGLRVRHCWKLQADAARGIYRGTLPTLRVLLAEVRLLRSCSASAAGKPNLLA